MAVESTILKSLALLSAAYPRHEIADATPELYLHLLADIPDEILEAATLDHISRSTFYPTIAELRAAAANLATGADRLPTAYDAWQEVSQAIVRFGRDRKPDFANPILERTVSALGWRNLCLSTNQIADRARFIEAYNEFLHRAREQSVALPQVRALAARLAAPGEPAGRLPLGEDLSGDESDSTGDQPGLLDWTGERASVFSMSKRSR